MKNIAFLILLIFALKSSAQQGNKKQNINYIEYADSVKEYGKKTMLLAGNVRMWFNEEVSHQQSWLPLPAIALSPTKGNATEVDSTAYINYKAESEKRFYSQKVNVCVIKNGEIAKKMFLNYDIKPGKTVAYFSPNIPKDSITYKAEQTKNILGLQCNLALYHIKDAEGNPEIVKVWYTKDIPLSFGPERYAQQLPGMVMKVESSLHNYTAIKMDMPSSVLPNFELEPKKQEVLTYQEVRVLFQKRYDEYVRNSTKQ